MIDEGERRDNSQIMHSIGQLTGAVQAMHTGLTARIDDIKADIRRLEQAQSERMDRIEDGLGKRIDDVKDVLGKRIDDVQTGVNTQLSTLGDRVTSLEVEDKKLIEKTALSGGLAGTLAAGAIELIKHLAN